MNDNPAWTREELLELHNSFVDPEEADDYDERYVDDHEPAPCSTCRDSGVFMSPNPSGDFYIFPCMVCSAFATRTDNLPAAKFVETERLCNLLRMHKWKYVWVKDKQGRIVAHRDGKRCSLITAIVLMGFDFHYEQGNFLESVGKFYDHDKIERTLFDG